MTARKTQLNYENRSGTFITETLLMENQQAKEWPVDIRPAGSWHPRCVT